MCHTKLYNLSGNISIRTNPKCKNSRAPPHPWRQGWTKSSTDVELRTILARHSSVPPQRPTKAHTLPGSQAAAKSRARSDTLTVIVSVCACDPRALWCSWAGPASSALQTTIRSLNVPRPCTDMTWPPLVTHINFSSRIKVKFKGHVEVLKGS